MSSTQFSQHQHQRWHDGLTLSISASARPGSLFGGPDVPCFVPHLSDLELLSQDILIGETLYARRDLPLAGRSLCLCSGSLTFP